MKMFLDLKRTILVSIILYGHIIKTRELKHSSVETDGFKQTFTCLNGQIIAMEYVCNAVGDCYDFSDEQLELCSNIRCPIDSFRCRNGACVDKSARCNGRMDCRDFSDESQCTEFKKCGESQYLCTNGYCISKPLICNGEPDCADSSDEFPDICQKRLAYSMNEFHCAYGGSVPREVVCDNYMDCVDGSDEELTMCNSANHNMKCKLPETERILFECMLNNKSIPCGKEVEIGTITWLYCNSYYINSDETFAAQEVYCQRDGRWNNELMRCIPDCGKRYEALEDPAVPLIVHGRQTEPSLWPWHAVLYFLDNDQFTFNCGGSLIAEKIVITAAHCLWQLTPDMVKVGFGKRHSNFSTEDEGSEIRNVASIIIQPLYQDSAGQYGSDIALLILEEPVQFSTTIQPVCIDWNVKYANEQLAENSTGSIVGMGFTENKTYSEKLLHINLHVQSYEICQKKQPKDFRKYITYTSFCAGTDNATGVCNGDSGGGLVFPDPYYRWILQGLVSVSPRERGTNLCDPTHYTMFTKIVSFLPWLKNIVYDNASKGIIEFPT